MRACPECGAEQRTQSERGVGWWLLTVGGVAATHLGLAGLGLAFLWLDVSLMLVAAAVLAAAQLQWWRWMTLRAAFLTMAEVMWRLVTLGWWALAGAVWAGAWWAHRAALAAWDV